MLVREMSEKFWQVMKMINSGGKTMGKKKEKEIKKVVDGNEIQPGNEASTEKMKLSGFDMSEFISKPIDSGIVMRREQTVIPAKKPSSQQFFRIHPTQEVTVDVFDNKEDGNLYLVRQAALPYLSGLTKRVILHVGMFLSGGIFLFPVPQPDERNYWNSWHQSASRVVKAAKEHWIRIQPDKTINGYQIHEALGNLMEPEWPDKDMLEYLSTAFANAIITDGDHPIVKALSGIA